jgi:small nuclear ribonucleoprotein (snRNP)-like protein
MKTAAEYRAMAEECFKWAREAQNDEVRVSLKARRCVEGKK